MRSHNLQRLWGAFAVTALLLAGAAPARSSSEEDPVQQAYRLWDEGLAHHKAGRWKEAVECWTQAYAKDAKPQYLWSLARDEQRAKMYVKARAHYRLFVTLQDIPPDLRSRIQLLRAEAAEHIAEITALLNARAQEQTAPSRPAPAATNEPPASPHVSSVPTGEDAASTNLHASGVVQRDDTGSWVVLGAGVTLLAVGGGMTAWAAWAKDGMDRYASPPPGCEAPYKTRYDQAASTHDTANVVSYVAYGLGATGLAVGLVMLLDDTGTSTDSAAAGSASASAPTVTLAPWWSSGLAGLHLGVEW